MRTAFLFLIYKWFKKDTRFLFYDKLSTHLECERSVILKYQNTALKNLVEHAYTKTKFYKELLDGLGLQPSDIQTQEDLKKIPVLTKQTIKDNLENLKSNDRFGENLIKCTSGGSTGEQALIYKSGYFNEMSRAAWLRNNAMIGWFPQDRSVWFWPSRTEHRTPLNKVKAQIVMYINRRLFLNAYDYSERDFIKWHKEIIRFQPKVVYGYASIILEFAQFMLKNNLKLPSVKIVVCTAEKLREREVMAKAFNCKVHNQYGCSEVIAIGIETANRNMLLTDDVVLLRTNIENQFLITPLHSYGFPLLNYQVADVGENLGRQEVHEAIPFPIMNLTIGRMSDYFLKLNNQKVSSVALSGHLSTLNLGIKQHQIVQRNYGQFAVNFIRQHTTDVIAYQEKIRMSLEKYFGDTVQINFYEVDKMTIEKSGKRLLFKRTFRLDL